jgi:hypothetical protein
LKSLLTIVTCLSLASCGGGNGEETQPVASSPPTQTPIPVIPNEPLPIGNEPIEIPLPPLPLEPVVIPEPMPVESNPPIVETPTPPITANPFDPYTHGVASNRTTVSPTPPVGMYSIYRSELTNSITPWNEYIGSFHSLEEAEARFKKDDEPLMYGEGFQYLIMTGIPNDIYSFSWPCTCIPR